MAIPFYQQDKFYVTQSLINTVIPNIHSCHSRPRSGIHIAGRQSKRQVVRNGFPLEFTLNLIECGNDKQLAGNHTRSPSRYNRDCEG